MTEKNFQHYTYKVTFPGMPWFYFGVHTDNGKPYHGSPKTHKWIWKFYEFEVQTLEWFETREEAESVENRLISHFIDDPHCLNEHWGGGFSREVSRKVGANTPLKQLREMGKKTQSDKDEYGRSLHALKTLVPLHQHKDTRGKSKLAVKAAQVLHSTKTEEGKSVVALNNLHSEKTSEGKSVKGVKAASVNNLKRWEDPDHPELGVRSAPTLVQMQIRRGYPSSPENRRAVTDF